MSSGPRAVVGADMYGAGASPNVGYTNGSDSARPLCHVAIFSGACSGCRLSLLNSLCTRRGMQLTDRLERRGGLFLDSASTLFVGVAYQEAESYQKITYRPLLHRCRLAG